MVMAQLSDVILSNRLSDYIRGVLVFIQQLREFDWSRKGINEYLLFRSARLFDIRLESRKPAYNKRSKIMRSLKYQTKIKKRGFKHFLKRIFRRNEGEVQQQTYCKPRGGENPFSRNVMRNQHSNLSSVEKYLKEGIGD